MRLIRHPLVNRDLAALVDHIVETTQGDFAAASRRLGEVDNLLAEIAANLLSGTRLAPQLEGWLVRHGGRGHRITIVFRADQQQDVLYVALVAFGGRDWFTEGASRKAFGD
jgi:plasmid stabilization system protein ParE